MNKILILGALCLTPCVKGQCEDQTPSAQLVDKKWYDDSDDRNNHNRDHRDHDDDRHRDNDNDHHHDRDDDHHRRDNDDDDHEYHWYNRH